MKKGIYNMKMNTSSVGQASRLSEAPNRKGKLWPDENFDRAIRDEEEFLEKINCIANNPIKVNLANKYEEYKWLLSRDG